ncbi:phosphatase PAP2 family protein [Streptomyces stelliscabiei]|uniref:phosphatase PAP2 family protein n=1 Tax=Streptomyces stelliscabiei TaxID=146820 RepID=UPI0029BFA7B9|nr:phosphatase PAP2 family protein [Streptomyces stelliscabiei]MDX2661063.1 phosphatase PAP2 family protein [Streptomyces stelliscabiei]MDX2715930.1 phosphatase PAP2 family protein [Streptomyces stelliscabiei]MDX2790040.1 phosphatase PAP2 family protein [Streptomyces stelliscabiei]
MNRRDAADLAGTVGLGAWVAFGVLAMVVIGHDGAPLWPDDGFLTWSLGHRPDVAEVLARGVTDTGSGAVSYVLAALAGAIVGRTVRQRMWAAALSLACLGAGQALRYGVMTLVQRPRPAHADWAASAGGWAFPSGHTTTAGLTAGLLIVAVSLRAPRGATSLRVVIGCWGVLVGLSRVYLGVHWFTDVIGGWLFATGWLGVCLYAITRWPPASFVSGTPRAPDNPTEGHAPQDPGRRGRSRPA